MPLHDVSSNSTTAQDGWIDDQDESWTYVSATSFKIVGRDVTTKYTTGTRIKCNNGGSTVYFVVVSSSFSSDTTVTITGGSDYTLANSSISANFHSYAANPQGYPGWFAFTASTTGFSSFTKQVTRFNVIGRACTVSISISGTSNGTGFSLTLPITCSANLDATNGLQDVARVQDNSGSGSTGLVAASQSSATLNIYKDLAASGWTASGTKSVFKSQFTYEI